MLPMLTQPSHPHNNSFLTTTTSSRHSARVALLYNRLGKDQSLRQKKHAGMQKVKTLLKEQYLHTESTHSNRLLLFSNFNISWPHLLQKRGYGADWGNKIKKQTESLRPANILDILHYFELIVFVILQNKILLGPFVCQHLLRLITVSLHYASYTHSGLSASKQQHGMENTAHNEQ